MPINLVDVAKYYSGFIYQTQALQRLQQQIEASNPALLADDSDFVRLWRNQTTVQNDFLISAEGIGPARVGNTYGQIKQALGSEYTYSEVNPFMVDLSAIAVLREGISGFFPGRAIAFYLTYPESTELTDSTPINLIITANPKYQTLEGTGPGTLLSEAVRDYGKALLSVNFENESREFVQFARQPSGLTFRAEALTHSFAGDYSVPDATRNDSLNQTPAFFENASISQVWVQKR
ncbi:MAG: hypothetical protein HLUCCA11_06200 [Phormidesmis priestleyi Ana]|uniref:Uncharacterized protein n=1 Tax=Phormidesmis priestleyi Ana TaxID=1666911 RepID=A0A0P8A0L5_9CYAN|nr:MAG: hypothetical protein HLUCCA11_06200 [Phormidesmis priestleyi Ana]